MKNKGGPSTAKPKPIPHLNHRFLSKKQEPPRHEIHGQVSAQMKRKRPDPKPIRLESPLYAKPKMELNKIHEQRQLLTEEQIRNSALYKMLGQQIRELSKRQQEQIQKLKKVRDQKIKDNENIKKQQFSTKLQIWQLKNQVFDIKQLIQQQKNQTERLMQQIQPQESASQSQVNQHLEPMSRSRHSESIRTQQQV